jgi:hypothetical protein
LVKARRAQRAKMRAFARYFRLAFILSKQRAIMVNGFRFVRMNRVLSGIPLQPRDNFVQGRVDVTAA